MGKVKSEKSHAILDEESRYKKAEKIVKVIESKHKKITGNLLDIGTGSGHIPYSFAKNTKAKVYSVDITDERTVKEGYIFKQTKDATLPFEDNFFDVVVTNHVIEHVLDQHLHMKEIARVLKKDGVAYLATPTKHWLYDPHYTLPFISWLPRRLSTAYLKLVRGKNWDIYPMSTVAIKKMAKKHGHQAINVTPEIIKNPEQFNLDTYKLIQPIMKVVPLSFLKVFEMFLPTSIYILKKAE